MKDFSDIREKWLNMWNLKEEFAFGETDVDLDSFKELVKEAHKGFFENPIMMFYSDSFEEISENSPFEDYNMYKDDYDEYEFQWSYEEDSDREICASFQMYPVRIPDDERCPILPGIYVKKIQLEA